MLHDPALLVESALEAIGLQGAGGVPLSALWQLLPHTSTGDLPLQSWLFRQLRTHRDLTWHRQREGGEPVDGRSGRKRRADDEHTPPAIPAAQLLEMDAPLASESLRVVASASLRAWAVGADEVMLAELTATQMRVVEALGREGRRGVLVSELIKSTGLDKVKTKACR